MRGIGKLLTIRDRIVWSYMVIGPGRILLGDLIGREIFVGERYWETVDCRSVHSEELHGE